MRVHNWYLPMQSITLRSSMWAVVCLLAPIKTSYSCCCRPFHCGGCEVALVASARGPNAPSELPHDAPINIWLAPLVRLAYSLCLQPQGKVDLFQLMVGNVRAQVREVKKSFIIKGNREVEVHGWVYHLDHGRLLQTKDSDKQVWAGLWKAFKAKQSWTTDWFPY